MRLTLTTEQFDSITEGVEDFFGQEIEMRQNYGGRGMYGATCVGISGDDNRLPIVFLYKLAEELGKDFLDVLDDIGTGSTDSMGLGTIWYWRNITVEGK